MLQRRTTESLNLRRCGNSGISVHTCWDIHYVDACACPELVELMCNNFAPVPLPPQRMRACVNSVYQAFSWEGAGFEASLFHTPGG